MEMMFFTVFVYMALGDVILLFFFLGIPLVIGFFVHPY